MERERAKVGRDGKPQTGADAEAAAEARRRYEPAAIAGQARELASGDPLSTSLVERLEDRLQDAPRGRVGGVWLHCDRIEPEGADRYRIDFEAAQLAEIWIEGNGSTDLDCYVFDERGSLIDSRTDRFDNCLLAWEPDASGGFAIEIENLGSAPNEYCLATN